MPPRDADAIVILACGDVELARWPLPGSGQPDLAVVDRLARLHLAARRLGWSVRLCDAGPDLLALLDLVGLAGLAGRSEVLGQAERREQPRVEEVVMPDDPVA